ncbi:MAG: response regulator transcription factor [Clostridia bacterium]|nr:response regulator transcription factor [Clostridia bacterium]
MEKRILIVEDDAILRRGLEDLLTGAGFDAVKAASFREAAVKAEEQFDLFLVDIMLGDGSGLALCRRIRQKCETPIIILTALDGEEEVIAGLSAGADDYVTKPFRAGELLARIDANLRRSPANRRVKSGAVEYFPQDGRVLVNGEEKHLRRSEMTLLKLFLESGGRLLPRERLTEALWEGEIDSVEENTLTVLVSRLRKELGLSGGRDHIETVRGVGYRWLPPCEGAD